MPKPTRSIPHYNWVQTFSGELLDLIDPTPDMIHPEDIAQGLANICRFAGQTKVFYSVAQHSLCCAYLLEGQNASPSVVLQGLLHDAQESYLSDVPRPVKRLITGYKELEDKLWGVIAERFDIPAKLDPLVKQADDLILAHEAFCYLNGGPQGGWCERPLEPAPYLLIHPMSPDLAASEFMRKLKNLAVAAHGAQE